MELEGLLADGGSESDIISSLQEKVRPSDPQGIPVKHLCLIIKIFI